MSPRPPPSAPRAARRAAEAAARKGETGGSEAGTCVDLLECSQSTANVARFLLKKQAIRREPTMPDDVLAEPANALSESWKSDPRWKGIQRPYSARDVLRLRGSVHVEHTLARMGAERLWELLHTEDYVP